MLDHKAVLDWHQQMKQMDRWMISQVLISYTRPRKIHENSFVHDVIAIRQIYNNSFDLQAHMHTMRVHYKMLQLRSVHCPPRGTPKSKIQSRPSSVADFGPIRTLPL